MTPIFNLTKNNYIAVWEQWGAGQNTWKSQIICNMKWKPKKPIYVKNSGHLSNSAHGLFIINPWDYIITCDWWNKRDEEFNVEIYQIISVWKITDKEIEIAKRKFIDNNFWYIFRRLHFKMEKDKEIMQFLYWINKENFEKAFKNSFMYGFYDIEKLKEIGFSEQNIKEFKEFNLVKEWIKWLERDFDYYVDNKEKQKMIEDNMRIKKIDIIKVPDFLSSAINAAKDKAICYHCRELHFSL